MEQLLQLDTSLFLWINSFHNDFWDQVMFFATQTLSSLPLYVFLIFLMFKELGWKVALMGLLFVTLVVTMADLGSVHLFKNTFERLRPSREPALEGLVHIVNEYRGGKFGFISSHATNTFATALFFSLLFKRRWMWMLMVSWAAFISYTRIYLGVHYPGDVLGGMIFGSLIGITVYHLFRFTRQKVFAKLG